ncbi:MAG: hypothetical protein WDA75_06315 [Candidatus Latescibacterota bacterium]|jgi:hypothetical protein
MVARTGVLQVTALGFFLPGATLFAQDLSYLAIKGGGGGTGWIWVVLGVLGIGLVAALGGRVLRALFSGQDRATPRQARRPRPDFAQQAAKLGFRIVEIKALRAIASRLAAQDPTSLLNTDAGRERLTLELGERIRKREREVGVLKGLQEKLRLMRDNQMHERANVRVEADLSVWVVKKDAPRGPEPEAEEDIFSEIEQVAGRLLDLSEGGAALIAELEVRPNELVELWSADSASSTRHCRSCAPPSRPCSARPGCTPPEEAAHGFGPPPEEGQTDDRRADPRGRRRSGPGA